MTGLVILAAGPSLRLGQPKQKMRFKGQTLLQRAVAVAKASSCHPIVIVLGAYENEIKGDIESKDLLISHNLQWQEGMASSIRSGIGALEKSHQNVDDIILMVCDQPLADTALITAMINKKAITGKGIIACAYNDTLGVPVLFDKQFFPELLSLEGQEGAKKLILKHKERVADVSFPLGGFDIDTLADYETLLSRAG